MDGKLCGDRKEVRIVNEREASDSRGRISSGGRSSFRWKAVKRIWLVPDPAHLPGNASSERHAYACDRAQLTALTLRNEPKITGSGTSMAKLPVNRIPLS